MKFSLFGASLIFALAPLAPAFAATPTPMATLMPASKSAAVPGPNLAGDTPLAMTVRTYKAVAYGERASKLIGATVYNERNQAIGKVADLVINPQDSLSIVIISVGGFLGLGAKDVAISSRECRFMPNRVILPRATAEVLQQLPAFHFAH